MKNIISSHRTRDRKAIILSIEEFWRQLIKSIEIFGIFNWHQKVSKDIKASISVFISIKYCGHDNQNFISYETRII